MGRVRAAGFRRTRMAARASLVACALLVVGATCAPRAHADPATAWPGFKGVAAQRLAAGSDDAAKHLYTFGTPYAWNTPVVWNYNDANRPAGLTLDHVIAGINAATKQWTDVCHVTITRGADTTSAPQNMDCLLYTSPSPRDRQKSRMPSS